jgi:uncharacterized membrane protein YidH (DUF202 family)
MPFMPMRSGGELEDGGPTIDPTAEQRHFEFERMLMDADRMMMQMVNLALSLIGVGFSINAFFTEAARAGAQADKEARMLGIFLVLLGLLFLSMGIWTQARYRRELIARYGRPAGSRLPFAGRSTPPFVTAFLLLVAGLGALGIMLFRRLV